MDYFHTTVWPTYVPLDGGANEEASFLAPYSEVRKTTTAQLPI